MHRYFAAGQVERRAGREGKERVEARPQRAAVRVVPFVRRLAALHLLRSAPRTRLHALDLVVNWSAAKNVIAPASAPLTEARPPRRSVCTQAATTPKKKPRQKGSLLPRPGSVAFVEPRVLETIMGSSAGTHERYAGPVPTCPRTLNDPTPELTREMLRVPTSELYSAALEAAWQELEHEGERPTPDRVAQLEPNSKEYSSPRPRHYGPYAVERASLDWSYHVVPNRARQTLQDEIVSLVLEKRLRDCRDAGDDEPCRVFEAREGFSKGEEEGKVSSVGEEDMGRKGDGRPGDKGRPLALFTAGCVSAFPAGSFPSKATLTQPSFFSGMGAGKGHTLRAMLRSDTVRLPNNTVWCANLLHSFRGCFSGTGPTLTPTDTDKLAGSTRTRSRASCPNDLSTSKRMRQTRRPCCIRKRPCCKRSSRPSRGNRGGVSSSMAA